VTESSLTILIVDDATANLKLAKKVVQQLGHRAVLAHDGEEALQRFDEVQPDLVLMDVVMPVMDGITATRALRQRLAHTAQHVPILLLSALDGTADVLRGLEAGADDYLPKPINVAILQAKLRNFARLVENQRELARQNKELADRRARAEEEAQLAAYVFTHLTDREDAHDPQLRIYQVPYGEVSGELVCGARTPAGVLHVLLADATGHGLPAALSALPVTEVFHSMTANGYSLSAIAREINRKLKRLLPVDRFVAATLIAVDGAEQVVEIWNGGNPDVVWRDGSGKVTRFRSVHPPLGILPEKDFCSQPQVFTYTLPGELIVCSDGLIEAESPEGRAFGLEAVIANAAAEGKGLQAVVGAFEAHLGGGPLHDDATLLFIGLPQHSQVVSVAVPPQERVAASSGYRLGLCLGPSELRQLEVVPGVMDFLMRIPALKPHQGALFVILSELFNNALDHGVLGLDSRLKAEPGGFERYLQTRIERLYTLQEGKIELQFHLHNVEGGNVLDVTITDSGPGFDYGAYLREPLTHDRPHGRGIALVRSLCSELVYSGVGNSVRARYAL